MLNKLIKRLADKIVAWCEKNDKVYYITGGVNDKTVYLVRYIVFKSKYLCIYIHRFLRSDADDPHDHPWNFFTYIIDGGYTEVFYDKTKPVVDYIDVGQKDLLPFFRQFWTKTYNRRTPNTLAYRKATDIHKVEVDKELELQYTGKISKEDKKIIEQAPYTVCIIGKRRRDWGFWPKNYSDSQGANFVDWRAYLNIVPNDPKIEGSE